MRAIDRALKDTDFDQDVKVQVFEGMSVSAQGFKTC